MEELFSNISLERKNMLRFLVDTSFYKGNPELIAKEILKIRNEDAKTEEEKQFIDLCFSLNLFNLEGKR